MKDVHTAILAVFLAAVSSLTVQAQTNTAYGTGALHNNTSGTNNTAFGYAGLFNNTKGSANTAVGDEALYFNTTGGANVAFGTQTLFTNSTGSDNTATGDGALYANSTGIGNTGVGQGALGSTTGSGNVGLGNEAGASITTGSYNIDIGYNNYGKSSDTGVVRIGTGGTQSSFYAAGISGVAISSGVPVYINSNGQLGTVNSSIRFKEDIHDMAEASSKLFQLRPVTYRYKQAYEDGSKPVDYGLIAEEVAQVYPDMVARDASGQILTVQYQKLTPMLLNELQKEHQQIDLLEQRLSALEEADKPKSPLAAN